MNNNDNHPPKPAIAIRVGVTGHRLSRLDPAHMGRINAEIDAILDAIADGVAAAHQKYAREYANDAPLLYLVSALADGADTLAAQRALDRGWRLLAPLPFVKKDYARDFAPADLEKLDALLARAEAVAELDGARQGTDLEERAYLQAGMVMVHQSDFIIAVWDGEEARGLAGTAKIKEEALAAGKRVVWVNAAADRQPVFLEANDEETLFTAEAVHDALGAILAPPPREEIEHEFSGKRTHALHAYHGYLDEAAHRINFGAFFQFWEKLIAGSWPFNVALTISTPDEEITGMRKETLASRIGAPVRDTRVFDEIIIPRFCWADRLAVHYGNLYRSSYFFNYLFAALAVFLALFDLVASFGGKTVWISTEVTLIVMILAVTTAGKRGRWHEKWIDYRQLAEELRQFRHLFLTADRGARHDDPAQGEGAEAAGWVEWYFAATRREAGLTSARFDGATMHKIAEAILEDEIRPQIAYHGKKAHILHKLEHRLHIMGEFAFGLTLLVCLVYLTLVALAGGDGALAEIAYEAKKNAKGWVTLLTGFLPSLGAALFGIRVQGEFGSTAERSHATAAQLKLIVRNLEAFAKTQKPRLETLQLRVEEAARAMLLENMDWRMLYISKPLNLPG